MLAFAARYAAPRIALASPAAVSPHRRSLLASTACLLALSTFSRPVLASATEFSSDMASLEQAKIIPDILDRVSAASQAQLVVEFQGKAVQHGELLTPAATKSAPVARVKGGAEGGLFTILCTDPDPPDPAAPKFREWLHWIVANVPSGGDSTQGQTVTPYRGPSPPIGTHRYVFMLFQQPNQEPLQLSDPSGGDPMARRASFSTRKFAAAHSLGDPVAVTWFNAHK